MRRSLLFAVALVVALAAPAAAHEEITPAVVPVGRPVFLSIGAANEKRVNLTTLTLTAPPGVAFGEATRDPSGWKGARTGTAITWTGGAVEPGHFETFGFEIEGADQPGALTYKATLGFADGSTEEASVVVTASSTAGTGDATAGPTRDGGASGPALALGALALAVSAAALAVALAARRRRPPGGDPAQDW